MLWDLWKNTSMRKNTIQTKRGGAEKKVTWEERKCPPTRRKGPPRLLSLPRDSPSPKLPYEHGVIPAEVRETGRRRIIAQLEEADLHLVQILHLQSMPFVHDQVRLSIPLYCYTS